MEIQQSIYARIDVLLSYLFKITIHKKTAIKHFIFITLFDAQVQQRFEVLKKRKDTGGFTEQGENWTCIVQIIYLHPKLIEANFCFD